MTEKARKQMIAFFALYYTAFVLIDVYVFLSRGLKSSYPVQNLVFLTGLISLIPMALLTMSYQFGKLKHGFVLFFKSAIPFGKTNQPLPHKPQTPSQSAQAMPEDSSLGQVDGVFLFIIWNLLLSVLFTGGGIFLAGHFLPEGW